MQEEYGIKLKILTENLQSSVNKAKGIVSNFVTKIKTDIEQAREPIELNVNGSKFNNQIRYTEDKIDKLKSKLNDKSISLGDFLKTEADIERLTNQLNKLKQKTKEAGDEAENTKNKFSGISINANMTNNTIVNGFGKSWKSIKKFAFSLLSLRGIYGLVRKASSSYMAQDTGLAQQMQRTWASVGAMLAPIIQTLVKWIRIGAAYLNYFVKALTGKDLIGKAVKKINAYNKSLGGTAKAAKSVNKELTTLDEVTNLSLDDGNINNFNDSIADVSSGFDDFGDVELNPKITKFLDTVAEKVQWVGEKLKPVINWAKEHPGAVLTILGGAKLLSLLMRLTGASGLVGLLPLLKGLATIGVVVAGVDLIYNAVTGKNLINDLKEIISGLISLNGAIKNNTKQSDDNTKKNKELNNMYKENIENGKASAEQYQKEADKLLGLTKRRQSDNRTLYEQYTLTGFLTGANKDLVKQKKNNEKTTKRNLDTLKLYYEAGVLTTEQKKDYKQALIDEIDWLENEYDTTYMNAKQTKEYKDKLKDLKGQFEDLTGKKYNAKVEVSTREAENNVSSLKGNLLNNIANKTFMSVIDVNNRSALDKTKEAEDALKKADKKYTPTMDLKVGTKDAKNKISDFATKANKALVGGSLANASSTAMLKTLLASIPAYDVGTNYVPNDQLAMVHKGEAIVPKKFNNEQFFNSNSEETNALLVEVNQNLIELRNRPNVLEVNGRELAQATYNDYQNEGNRLNQSMTIKRSG